MTIDIGDIIINRLATLPWLDKYVGVVKTLSYQGQDSLGKTIIKRMPVSCRTSQNQCSSGTYIDLCPDNKKKSIFFLKDNGVRFVSKDGDKYYWRASYNAVGWLNLPKLGYENCNYSGVAITGILSKFPSSPFQEIGSIYQRVMINVDGQLSQNTNPFSEYTFPEEITQYLMYPYEAFVLPITVDFMINKSCLSALPLGQPIACLTNNDES